MVDTISSTSADFIFKGNNLLNLREQILSCKSTISSSGRKLLRMECRISHLFHSVLDFKLCH